MTFFKFIIDQLIKEDYTLTIKDEFISIAVNNNVYQEKKFNPECKFDDQEISLLLDLTSREINFKEIIDSNLPILKSWYLITNEKYFKDDIILDKYGRVGQSNLLPDFLEILKFPIADIIKTALQIKLQLKSVKSMQVYLTSDFDILNIWDVWNIKDFIREMYLCTRSLDFKKLSATIFSFLFSRISTNYNGYLNEKMYCYNSKYINIGFFIASPTNSKFDGKINYQNKQVKKYIDRLKNKNVQFGLHTNFDTMDNSKSISSQQKDFENLFNQKAVLNRHHYLRFKFPDYLKTLEDGGVEKDFSIYFPESMLFRAGTCCSFFAWNIDQSRAYNVELIPTTLMDGTFTDYLFCDFKKALELSKQKIDLTLQYSDSIVLLWHNRSTYPYANIDNNYHPKLIIELINYIDAKLK